LDARYSHLYPQHIRNNTHNPDKYAVMMGISRQRVLLGCLMSLLAAGFATGVLYTCWGIVSGAPFIVILPAVFISAWVGGFLPGLLATAGSLIGFNAIMIIMPGETYNWSQGGYILALFVMVSVAISYLQHERLRFQCDLENTNKLLDTVLTNIADAVTAQHRSGELIFANPAAVELLGYDSHDTLMRASAHELSTRYDFSDEYGRPIPLTELPNFKAVTSRNVQVGTFLMTDEARNFSRWIRLKTVPLNADGPFLPHMVNVFQDVTEQRQKDAKLAELNMRLDTQRTRLENTLQNLPGIVWEGTGYGKNIEFVSDYAMQLLGYSKKEWLTVPDFWRKVVIHPDDWYHVAKTVIGFARQGQAGMVEFRCIAKDQRVIPVQAHLSLFPCDVGRQMGAICGVLIDITEQKRAEVALRRSNEDLQQFAYVASHDLREPLRMVNSYMQLIERRYYEQLDEDGREFLRYAVDGGQRMKMLIDDLLDFSQLEKKIRSSAQVSTEQVVEGVLAGLSGMIAGSNAEVRRDPLPDIIGDDRLLAQLFQNLIINALKFHAPGRPPHVRISATTTVTGNMVRFAVADNGIGIDENHSDTVFQMFQRLHTVDEYDGTGMGLAICKKVVQRYGGEIWFESRPNCGTIFYLTLPAAAQKLLEAQ